MTYDELMDIVGGSRSSNWLYHDPTRTYVYRDDLNIRMRKRDLLEHQRKYVAQWTEVFDKPYAEKVCFDIYYGASAVRSVILVEVDEGRGILPIPSGPQNAVEAEDYAIARCLDREGTLDSYIMRAGMNRKD